MNMPTHSEFQRFEDRVDDTIARQVGRVESKVDGITQAIARLVVFEERQHHHAARFDTLAEQVGANQARAAAMAERFDNRCKELEARHQLLVVQLHGYVQRYVGAAAVAGVGWAVASKFIH